MGADRSNTGRCRTIPKTVILSTARTPIGKLGGALASIDATVLGGAAIREALARAGVAPEDVQHVVMGQAIQAGQGQIPSRQAQIASGIPPTVTSETVNKVCASALRAVCILDWAIRAGDLELAVGGGMESMSQAPYLLRQARFGYRMGDADTIDAMVADGLTSQFTGKHMAHEATEVADEAGFTRSELDRFAARSHELALAAIDSGRMREEIVPVTVPRRSGAVVVEVDESPRRGTTIESLAVLPPIFVAGGSHTAGNSPGVNDGAAALVLAADTWAERQRRPALAKILAQAQFADDYPYRARATSRAALAALQRAGLRARQVDLWEINEAFATVTLGTMRILELDEKRVNVNGGAVALGHPIGASGARILGSLVLELRRRGGGIGCAAICSGGGQGDAVVVRVG